MDRLLPPDPALIQGGAPRIAEDLAASNFKKCLRALQTGDSMAWEMNDPFNFMGSCAERIRGVLLDHDFLPFKPLKGGERAQQGNGEFLEAMRLKGCPDLTRQKAHLALAPDRRMPRESIWAVQIGPSSLANGLVAEFGFLRTDPDSEWAFSDHTRGFVYNFTPFTFARVMRGNVRWR